MIDILNIKKNHLLVSRAATGIFLVLDNKLKKGSKVLVPANLCYAAVYPIIYSGNIPVFCDVELDSGNMSLDTVKNNLNEIDAIIIPHMYGNPVQDIEEIVNECHKNNVLVIEDCASSMGASINNVLCGSFGDYSVFSTGYSKTLDIGGGGILLSNENIDDLSIQYNKLDNKIKNLEEKEKLYSKLYRQIRNGIIDYDDNNWEELNKDSKELFVYNDRTFDSVIYKEIVNLDKVITSRINNNKLYTNLLKDNRYITLYKINEGSVPWRFCFFVNNKLKSNFIVYLLNNGVPISDWYPNVTPIFGNRQDFSNVDKMEKEILNLPLLIDEDEIVKICKIINSYEFE